MGLSALLTYSVAGAQSDGDWFETALEETLRLSSPWELPIMPEFDPGSTPDSSSLAPDSPHETKIVLEVPWGSEAVTQVPSEAPSEKALVVRLVDDFEDPWHESEARAASTVPTSSEAGVPMNAVKAEVDEPSEPSTSSTPPKDESPELTDPWAD